MKTAQEMVQILEHNLEFELKMLNKYQKKYEKTGKKICEQIAMERMEVLIVLEYLYKDFTGKEYKFKEEN